MNPFVTYILMDRRGREKFTKTPDFKCSMWIQVESQLVDQFSTGEDPPLCYPPSHSFQADYCSFLLEVHPELPAENCDVIRSMCRSVMYQERCLNLVHILTYIIFTTSGHKSNVDP